MKPPTFTAAQFTPTPWNTAEDKAKWANHCLRFIAGDFKDTLFPRWFYQRLAMMFGHIAHYDRGGFYAEWFEDLAARIRWLEYIGRGGMFGEMGWGMGSAAHTYSDVEQAISEWLRAHPVKLATMQAERALQHEEAERQQLARLQAKYGAPLAVVAEPANPLAAAIAAHLQAKRAAAKAA